MEDPEGCGGNWGVIWETKVKEFKVQVERSNVPRKEKNAVAKGILAGIEP